MAQGEVRLDFGFQKSPVKYSSRRAQSLLRRMKTAQEAEPEEKVTWPERKNKARSKI
jgi:hypothetical protein